MTFVLIDCQAHSKASRRLSSRPILARDIDLNVCKFIPQAYVGSTHGVSSDHREVCLFIFLIFYYTCRSGRRRRIGIVGSHVCASVLSVDDVCRARNSMISR